MENRRGPLASGAQQTWLRSPDSAVGISWRMEISEDWGGGGGQGSFLEEELVPQLDLK